MLDQYMQQVKEKEQKLQQLNKKGLALKEQLANAEDDVAKTKEEYNQLVGENLDLMDRIVEIERNKQTYKETKKILIGGSVVYCILAISASAFFVLNDQQFSMAFKIIFPASAVVIGEAVLLKFCAGNIWSLKKSFKNINIKQEKQKLETAQKELSVKTKELEASKNARDTLTKQVEANRKEQRQLLGKFDEINIERMEKIDPLVEALVDQGMVTDKLEMTPKAKALIKGQRQNLKQG